MTGLPMYIHYWVYGVSVLLVYPLFLLQMETFICPTSELFEPRKRKLWIT